MAEVLARTALADLEVRGGTGRTVCGLCVPYGVATPISDLHGRYEETFCMGAFARTIAERGPSRTKFLAQHDRQSLPLGRAEVLREDTRGLYGEFKVSKTAAGDEVLELISDGALDAFSIGFQPVRDEWSRDRSSVTRLEAKLPEVSVVSFPAYEGAGITGVRTAYDPAALARARLTLLLERTK